MFYSFFQLITHKIFISKKKTKKLTNPKLWMAEYVWYQLAVTQIK